MKLATNKVSGKLLSKTSLIFLSGFILRLLLVNIGTLDLDFNTFLAWSNTLGEYGFSGFYNNTWSDYLPGYLYILWFLQKINLLSLLPTPLLYKLPAIISDVATSYIIYKIVLKLKGERWAITSSLLYLFNPAIIANSAMWGQVDSLTALFSLLSIWLVNTNPIVSAVFLSVGTIIKPQAAIASAVILFVMLSKNWPVKKMIGYILVGLVVFLIGFLPFASSLGTIGNFVVERLSQTTGQYPVTSANAFNFWGLKGLWEIDHPAYTILGMGVVLAVYLSFGRKLFYTKGAKYSLAGLLFLAGFMFMTRMHERHMLPSFAPLAISVSFYPTLLIPYSALSLTYLVNLLYSYWWVTFDHVEIIGVDLIKLFSLVNVAMFVGVAGAFLSKKNQPAKTLLKLFAKGKGVPAKLAKRKSAAILVVILVFSLTTRLYSLGSPQSEYFDEVYHAFTAKRMSVGDAKAWEWWNTPPEGFAFEWTHPPLAKEIMAAGMSVFGPTSFGWRFPAAIAGALTVLLVYSISKQILKSETTALFAAFFFSLDGLTLVMSRIGMNDIYMLVFALGSVYFVLKQKHFASATLFGLALAAKWSALWVIPIIVVAHVMSGKFITKHLVWYFIIPPAIYVFTYLPMFATGHTVSEFVGVQKQMWWYHTGLDATHPYASAWWSWPLLVKPIYLYLNDPVGNLVSKIYAQGNPFVFWPGFVSVVFASIYSAINKNKKIAFFVFAYLVFFVPWAFSPRIMFLYHYLPSLPFMSILLSWVLTRYPKIREYVVVVSVLAFVYFYPHWTGISIPEWLDNSYYWFSSWR